MPLVLDHDRLDLRNLADLVPQRLRVVTRQLLPTTPAVLRLQPKHLGALVAGDQRRLGLGVPRLPARLQQLVKGFAFHLVDGHVLLDSIRNEPHQAADDLLELLRLVGQELL